MTLTHWVSVGSWPPWWPLCCSGSRPGEGTLGAVGGGRLRRRNLGSGGTVGGTPGKSEGPRGAPQGLKATTPRKELS